MNKITKFYMIYLIDIEGRNLELKKGGVNLINCYYQDTYVSFQGTLIYMMAYQSLIYIMAYQLKTDVKMINNLTCLFLYVQHGVSEGL